MVFTQLLVFNRLRFFDFDHHIGLGKNIRCAGNDSSSGGAVIVVAFADTVACTALDNDWMAGSNDFTDADRGETNAIFVGFNFAYLTINENNALMVDFQALFSNNNFLSEASSFLSLQWFAHNEITALKRFARF